MYKIKIFSPVNLSYINLIISPAIEPRREEEEFSSPIAECAKGKCRHVAWNLLPSFSASAHAPHHTSTLSTLELNFMEEG